MTGRRCAATGHAAVLQIAGAAPLMRRPGPVTVALSLCASTLAQHDLQSPIFHMPSRKQVQACRQRLAKYDEHFWFTLTFCFCFIQVSNWHMPISFSMGERPCCKRQHRCTRASMECRQWLAKFSAMALETSAKQSSSRQRLAAQRATKLGLSVREQQLAGGRPLWRSSRERLLTG